MAVIRPEDGFIEFEGDLRLDNGQIASEDSLLRFKDVSAKSTNRVKTNSETVSGGTFLMFYAFNLSGVNALPATQFVSGSEPIVLGIVETDITSGTDFSGYVTDKGVVELPYGVSATQGSILYIDEVSGTVTTVSGAYQAGQLITSGVSGATIYVNVKKDPGVTLNPLQYLNKYSPNETVSGNVTFLSSQIGIPCGTLTVHTIGAQRMYVQNVTSGYEGITPAQDLAVINYNYLKWFSDTYLVNRYTNQDIDGVKRFLRHPIAPNDNPTHPLHYVPKEYVDYTIILNVSGLSASMTMVKATSGDTVPTTLDGKIIAGVGINIDISGTPSSINGQYLVISAQNSVPLTIVGGSGITTVTSGSTVQLDVTGTFDTYKVKTSATGTDDYLAEKLLAGSGVNIVSGNTLTIDVTGTFDTYQVKTSSSGSAGYLASQILPGTNIAIANSGNDLTISVTGVSQTVTGVSGTSGVLVVNPTGAAVVALDTTYSPTFQGLTLQTEAFLIKTSTGATAVDTLDSSFGTSGIIIQQISNSLSGSEQAVGISILADKKIIITANADNVIPSVVISKYDTSGAIVNAFGGFTAPSGILNDSDGGLQLSARGVALDGNQKLVVGGYNVSGSGKTFKIGRVMDTSGLGFYDPNFGQIGFNGSYTFGINPGTTVDMINSVGIQSADGKIIAVGSTATGTDQDAIIIRYDASGVLDTSFNTVGYKTFNFASVSGNSYNSIQIQADTKFLIAGQSMSGTSGVLVLSRHNADGSLDGTFGTGGTVQILSQSGTDNFNSVKVQPDGKILVSAQRYISGQSYNFSIFRFDSSGTLDNTFGASGEVSVDIFSSGTLDKCNDFAIDKNNKIILAGFNDSQTNLCIARLNTDGSLDGTFGTSGVVTTTASGTLQAINSVRIQDDGRILVAGYTTISGTNHVLVARYGTASTSYLTLKDYILYVTA